MNWNVIKAIKIAKPDLTIQEVDDQGQYHLTIVDGSHKVECGIVKTTPRNVDQADYEDNYQSTANGAVISTTQNRPSRYQVSLRIEGDNWQCPAKTNAPDPDLVTIHDVPLNADYEIRGAEFQFINGKAGDFVEVWVTDRIGAVYPAGTRLTKYVNKFCVYDHPAGTQAWVADLVDDDTSDLVPSVFVLEFSYTNKQPAGSPPVEAIVNFWMYERTS